MADNERYWILDYSQAFSSDFHIGAGITLLGGNHHGLQLDDRGFPCMHHTEVRGLVRLGGQRLIGWDKTLEKRYNRNFGEKGTNKGLWSYTSARFPEYYDSPYTAEIMGDQSHIMKVDGVAENLFSYQKSGCGKNRQQWVGRIYSHKATGIKDAAFMFACMRAEDRIGHRRSRGYGRITWKLEKLRSYESGSEPVDNETSSLELLKIVFSNSKGEEE